MTEYPYILTFFTLFSIAVAVISQLQPFPFFLLELAMVIGMSIGWCLAIQGTL
ncbi:MAG: hypothetical protein M0Q91_14430 [Methanoregula sp.]|nr:hypothetical protein [Methanoregula sp.]